MEESLSAFTSDRSPLLLLLTSLSSLNNTAKDVTVCCWLNIFYFLTQTITLVDSSIQLRLRTWRLKREQTGYRDVQLLSTIWKLVKDINFMG